MACKRHYAWEIRFKVDGGVGGQVEIGRRCQAGHKKSVASLNMEPVARRERGVQHMVQFALGDTGESGWRLLNMHKSIEIASDCLPVERPSLSRRAGAPQPPAPALAPNPRWTCKFPSAPARPDGRSGKIPVENQKK
eukprot:6205273-Pleurochrysis_carterae.AAC.1